MARIFICYRREDASGHAGRLRDALSARFGAHEIFRDIETIGPGEDFVQAMTEAIAGCRVFLAVIGRDWRTIAAPGGGARLDDPDDHVRREIAEALKRGMRVIPVLVEGATMPRAQDLPPDIRGLAHRNAVALDEPGWSADLERLMAAISSALGERDAPGGAVPAADPGRAATPAAASRARPALPRPLIAAAVVLVLLSAAVWRIAGGRDDLPDQDSSAQSGANDPVTGGADAPAAPASGAVNGSGSGGGAAVTLPRGGIVELQRSVYEVLGATLRPHATGATLALRMRLTNNGAYATGFSRAGFRLLVGESSEAPSNDLNEIVESRTSRDGDLTFEVPPSAAAAVLRITDGNETGDLPLDLAGRSGQTPERDRAARAAGAGFFPVTVDGTRAVQRFGELALVLRDVRLRRYANKLELNLLVRADNASAYAAGFGDFQFRLLVDGLSRAPVSGLSEAVDGRSSKEGTIVFDLPLGTEEVVLRTQMGEETIDLPLRLPDAG